MPKQLNQHVMKSAYRLGLTNVYKRVLAELGIEGVEIKPHMNSSATITLTDTQLEECRKLDGWTELTGHGNSGAITVHIPAAAEYLKQNRPTLTDDERNASKGGSGNSVASKEEMERRRAEKARLDQLLKGEHGIDLAE